MARLTEPFQPTSSVLIDTGSHALLLPQSNCTSCSPTQQKFNPADSSTFSYSPRGSASPGFSTGGDTIPLATIEGATCNWAIDQVSLPTTTTTTTSGTTTPISYEFLLCYQEAEALTTQPGIDGVLGLGVNGSDPAALQWALLEAGVLDSGVYGLYLPSGPGAGAGEITLGGVDETKFAPGSGLTWVSLDRELAAGHGQWVMDMQTIYVDGQQLWVPSSSGFSSSSSSSNTERSRSSYSSSSSSKNHKSSTTTTTANQQQQEDMVPYPPSIIQVLDSGTSSIMAPSYAVAEALYAQISPAIYQIDPVGTWGAPCAVMDALAPDITFTIGQEGEDNTLLNVTMPGRVFNLGPYNSSLPTTCQAAVNNWADPLSYDGRGLWELGSPLLKNYYTAWDGAGLRVGFAPLGASSGAKARAGETSC